VLFGIGDTTVEIVTVHQLEHLLQHFALLLLELTGIIAAAQHQHKVVLTAQQRRTAKDLQQRRNVLARIRPTDRQHRRSGGIAQKGGHQAGDAVLRLTWPGRMKQLGIDPRRDDPGQLGSKASITAVLMIPFLRGAGDHKLTVVQGQLLGVDPPRHRIADVDLAAVESRLNQAATFVPPQ